MSPGTATVRQYASLLYAHTDFVCIEFLSLQEHHRIRRHHRQPDCLRERRGGVVVLFLARLPDALQLDIEALGKPLGVVVHGRSRRRGIAPEQSYSDFTFLRAGERDQPPGRLSQPLTFHARPPQLLAVAISEGQQTGQIAIPFEV